MEPRKVIKFGNSSYVVTLPFEWVKKHALEKGSSLNLIENNGSILLLCDTKKNEQTAEIVLDNKPLKLFNRELISYYLKNYKYIKIIGENIIEKLEEIRVLKEKLSSIEIIEINPKYILLEDLTNPSGFKISSLIDEIVEMEKIFFDELIKEDKSKAYFVISNLDKNVNKLSFLGYKALNYNQSSLENLNQAKFSICYWRIISSFEKIGDVIKRIARYIKNEKENSVHIEKLILEMKDFFIFVTNLLGDGSKKDENLKVHLDKKNSLLREIENFRDKFKDDVNLYLVLTQLLKDIIGLLDEVVVSVIDLRA